MRFLGSAPCWARIPAHGSKKPAIVRITGFSFKMVPPAGFEPAISTLKGWRPWPLDDGDSGKEYSRLFAGAYIVGKLENHHTGVGFYSDFQISQSVTSERANRLYLLQIEIDGGRRHQHLNL